MFRAVTNVAWGRRLGLLGWRHELAIGRSALPASWGSRALRAMRDEQRTTPVLLAEVEGRAYWWFEDCVYWEDEALEAADVLALVRDRERRRQRRLERAHVALALDAEPAQRREPIPREVRLAVFQRDDGRCVECSSTFDLQYDHLIPVSLGGATTVENLQLLCAPCNKSKGGAL